MKQNDAKSQVYLLGSGEVLIDGAESNMLDKCGPAYVRCAVQ